MAINPLNHHYAMENPASVYDEDAMTALELAGRTTAKVNETVAAFNALEVQTDKKLTQQDTAINKMTKETMPAEVAAEFQRKIDDGTFDDMIDEYSRELSSRLDNVLGSIEEGSTSGDAELIDARLDIFGGTWDTAGNAMRGQAHKLHDMLEPLVGYKTTPLTVTLSNGWYDNTGKFVANTASTNHHATAIDVVAGETYYIKSRYGYSMADAMTVDEDGNLVQIFHTYPTEQIWNDYDKPIHISGKAAKLYVNSMSGSVLEVAKVTEYTFNNGAVWETLSNMFNALIDEEPVLGEALPITITPATCIYEGRVITVHDGNTKFRTATVPVHSGEVYHAHMTCGLAQNFYYYVFDAKGNVIEGMQAAGEGATAYDKTFLIPPNAATLVIAGYEEDPVIYPVNGYKTRGEGKFSNLKWVCLGDSLTEVNTRTTKRYHDYIKEQTGINVVNMGRSGSGYMRTQDSNNAYYQRIASMPADADVVTIFGSGNDCELVNASLGDVTDTGTNTICGCINKTIDAIYAIKPTVQLGIIAPTPWIRNMPSDNDTMTRYCEKLEAICKRRGIPYLDLFHGSGLRPNDATFRAAAYSKDEGNGVHPDETGHKMIAPHIYEFLLSLISLY